MTSLKFKSDSGATCITSCDRVPTDYYLYMAYNL